MAYTSVTPAKEKCTYRVINKTPMLQLYRDSLALINEVSEDEVKIDDDTFEDTSLVNDIYKELMNETVADDSIEVNTSVSMDTVNAKLRCSDKYTLSLLKNKNKYKFHYKIVKARCKVYKFRKAPQ